MGGWHSSLIVAFGHPFIGSITCFVYRRDTFTGLPIRGGCRARSN